MIDIREDEHPVLKTKVRWNETKKEEHNINDLESLK